VSDPALELDFRAVPELEPGPRWQALFEEFWPAYERWFRKEGSGARPSYLASARALREHMPELVPAWESLVDLAGGGDAAARFLSLWRPPAIVAGCSQAIWTRGDDVALVHNYDYAPRLCDGVILLSAWRDSRVIATTDCLIGALDGLNEHGLAAALAFGGRSVVGEGFAAPMVLRYVLETCATTAQAVAALQRVPVYMAYTFALVDRAGDHATVFCGPDRAATVVGDRVSTNHQQRVEWSRYARATDTVGRLERLRACAERHAASCEELVACFLEPPLYRRSFGRASGTLYTLACRPRADAVEHRWPDGSWHHTFDAFPERTRLVRYEPAPAA
jgi:predicted choloylglycine hydrolase